jgi:hypothetical protein
VHKDYLPSFRRLDDLTAYANTTLESRIRLVLLDFGLASNSPLLSFEAGLRKRLTKELVDTGCIKVVLPEEERDKVLHYVLKQEQERGQYKKETLIQFGHMYAASHGVFGTITQQGTNYSVTCTLANLADGTTESEQMARFVGEDGWHEFAGALLGARVLAQMARAQIVTPLDSSINGPVIQAEGFILLQPKGWSLRLAVLPDRNSSLFPQRPLTIGEDGSWKSTDVYLGTPGSDVQKFTIYALLADRGYTEDIDRYIGSKASTGLNINEWDPERHRKLHSIEVVLGGPAQK